MELDHIDIQEAIDEQAYYETTGLKRLRLKAAKLIDSFSSQLYSTIVSIIYILILSFEFKSEFFISKIIEKKTMPTSLLIITILEVFFILFFLIELMIKAFALPLLKLHKKSLSIVDIILLISIIVLFILLKITLLSIPYLINLVMVATRLLVQIYSIKVISECLENHEEETLESYDRFIKTLEDELSKKKKDSEATNDLAEEYQRNIDKVDNEITDLNQAVLENKRKSWGSMVSPFLSIQINLPIMNEKQGKRKSAELYRRKANRERCKSLEYKSIFSKENEE